MFLLVKDPTAVSMKGVSCKIFCKCFALYIGYG